MKVIDQISSQLESLTNDLRSAPTQIGALEAAAAAGVTIPKGGRFASLDDLDMALNKAFATPDGAPLDSPTMTKRIAVKNAVLSSGSSYVCKSEIC